MLLVLTSTRTSTFQRSFKSNIYKLNNDIPHELKQLDHYKFTNKIRDYLLFFLVFYFPYYSNHRQFKVSREIFFCSFFCKFLIETQIPIELFYIFKYVLFTLILSLCIIPFLFQWNFPDIIFQLFSTGNQSIKFFQYEILKIHTISVHIDKFKIFVHLILSPEFNIDYRNSWNNSDKISFHPSLPLSTSPLYGQRTFTQSELQKLVRTNQTNWNLRTSWSLLWWLGEFFTLHLLRVFAIGKRLFELTKTA